MKEYSTTAPLKTGVRCNERVLHDRPTENRSQRPPAQVPTNLKSLRRLRPRRLVGITGLQHLQKSQPGGRTT